MVDEGCGRDLISPSAFPGMRDVALSAQGSYADAAIWAFMWMDYSCQGHRNASITEFDEYTKIEDRLRVFNSFGLCLLEWRLECC